MMPRMTAVLAVAVSLVSAACTTYGADPRAKLEAASTRELRRGIWVYKVARLDTTVGRERLKGFVRAHAINNVYISATRELLSEPAFAELLAWMNGNGVHAEALVGSVEHDVAAACDEVVDDIERVVAYNAERDAQAERFVGIHVDIEPWIMTGMSLAWVDPLTVCYEQLRTMARNAGMPLIADVAGAKIKGADAGQRQAMLNAVTRLVLMQYTGVPADAKRWATEFLDGLKAPSNADGTQRGVIVALRTEDFDDVFPQVTALETALRDSGLYAGWGVYAGNITELDAGAAH